MDKVLTLRGGPELVAFWGQLGSIIDVVAGVALAGVGTGVSVLVAQADRPERQRGLLHQSLRLGLLVSFPVMVLAVAVSLAFPGTLAGAGISQGLVALAAVIGCVAVVPGLVNGYWLGQQKRGLMLALAAGTSAALLAAALAAPQAEVLAALALAQGLPALAAMIALRGAASDGDHGALRANRAIADGTSVTSPARLSSSAKRGVPWAAESRGRKYTAMTPEATLATQSETRHSAWTSPTSCQDIRIDTMSRTATIDSGVSRPIARPGAM